MFVLILNYSIFVCDFSETLLCHDEIGIHNKTAVSRMSSSEGGIAENGFWRPNTVGNNAYVVIELLVSTILTG